MALYKCFLLTYLLACLIGRSVFITCESVSFFDIVLLLNLVVTAVRVIRG